MVRADANRALHRRDNRVIIHFDYDCFYAAVFEAENPALKSLPLAVQQKHIIVTCNYEARRRGLRKLQLISDAKLLCPDVIIMVGEDLTRFRDASKALYNFLREYSWNDKVEKLGFDEVWMDVTDMVDYNIEVLNKHDLSNSFFQLSQSDPTIGFSFDGTRLAGYGFPDVSSSTLDAFDEVLLCRLMLGSHLALYLRHQLEEQKGYTSTVGISTSKLLSKLVGNVNKPKGQTTLLPPYESDPILAPSSNIINFIDSHDIGGIPYIGFKVANKLRQFALGRPPEFESGQFYGRPRDTVTVGQVRQIPELNSDSLEKLLSGPGFPHGIGAKVFASIHGVDDSEVADGRSVPKQISIEDSYIRLDTMDQVVKELNGLSKRLIERMRMDLAEHNDKGDFEWLAYPSTLRLSTRPRLPPTSDSTRARSANRISRSTPLPRFIFSMSSDTADMARRLVDEALIPLFKKLHPERSNWNLSLVNVAVTGMEEKQGGTDIDKLFKKQQESIREREQVEALPDALANVDVQEEWDEGSDGVSNMDEDAGEEASNLRYSCPQCGRAVPAFAKDAHERFHNMET